MICKYLIFMVPEAGLEPAQYQVPPDFEYLKPSKSCFSMYPITLIYFFNISVLDRHHVQIQSDSKTSILKPKVTKELQNEGVTQRSFSPLRLASQTLYRQEHMTRTGFFQHTDSRLDDRLRAAFVTVFRNESGNPLLWGNTTKEKKEMEIINRGRDLSKLSEDEFQ